VCRNYRLALVKNSNGDAVGADWSVSAMSLLPESRCANRCRASLSTPYRGDSIEGVDAGEARIATALNCSARILSVPINVGTNTWIGAIMLLRLELMQQQRIALAVQTHRHPTDRAMDDIALEGDALLLEVGHEAIKVFYL
jgi:hypothetical protein